MLYPARTLEILGLGFSVGTDGPLDADVVVATSLTHLVELHMKVMQCVAVCCSVLQCVVIATLLAHLVEHHKKVLQCVAVYCSVLQCIAVCCSERSRVLQCVAVCCSVLQCVAV